MSLVLHAGLIAARIDGRWRGVLIQGAAGAGKSDLALRALHAGFHLVADDRVTAWASGGQVFGAAPQPIAGLMEVRGVGVAAFPSRPFSPIALVVRAPAPGETVERLPDRRTLAVAGIDLPLMVLNLLEPSAPFKLAVALKHLPAGS